MTRQAAKRRKNFTLDVLSTICGTEHQVFQSMCVYLHLSAWVRSTSDYVMLHNIFDEQTQQRKTLVNLKTLWEAKGQSAVVSCAVECIGAC